MVGVQESVIRAALAGARSVRVQGWMGDECESAALERIARAQPTSTGIAFSIGKHAALDEMRTLTRYRRVGARRAVVSLDALAEDSLDEPGMEEPGYAAVEDRDAAVRRQRRYRLRLTEREVEVISYVAAGLSGLEAAERMGVDPSYISQVKERAARKLKPTERPYLRDA